MRDEPGLREVEYKNPTLWRAPWHKTDYRNVTMSIIQHDNKKERTFNNFPGSNYLLPADEKERDRYVHLPKHPNSDVDLHIG